MRVCYQINHRLYINVKWLIRKNIFYSTTTINFFTLSHSLSLSLSVMTLQSHLFQPTIFNALLILLKYTPTMLEF